MSTTDPIADYLTRIRNSILAKHDDVLIPHSIFKEEITKVLKDSNYISAYQVVEDKGRKNIWIQYRYIGKKNMINGLDRESKPGRRIYYKSKDIKPVQRGFGIAIYSTPKGLMTDAQAKQENVGGELLCTIY
ncbi:MAG: 30S ribosomal protein S8 [Pseudomonadota bacterium]